MFGFSVLFIINASFSFAFSDVYELQYEKGLEAFRNNQFALSIQEFELILNAGWVADELYYNLGNAYYRSGNISGAIWSYESCLKIKPNHSDAKYNLKLANLRVKDRVDFPEVPFYLKFYINIKERFSPQYWVLISVGLLFFFSIIFVMKKHVSVTLLHYLSSFISMLFFISLFFTFNSILNRNSNQEGIIYENKIRVYSEPNKLSTRKFEVNEGLKVKVGKEENKWLEIELLDGKNGWIEKKQIRIIS